jgi:hypothetical protein
VCKNCAKLCGTECVKGGASNCLTCPTDGVLPDVLKRTPADRAAGLGGTCIEETSCPAETYAGLAGGTVLLSSGRILH